MKNLIINNQKFMNNTIKAIFPKKEVLNYLSGHGIEAIRENKVAMAVTYSPKVRCVIIFTDPVESKLITNLVKNCFNHNKTVFVATYNPALNKCTFEEVIKENRNYYAGEYTHSSFESITALPEYEIIPDERRAKMRRYLRLYELDYPQTDLEWYLAFKSLEFYYKNNIEYSYDKNQYYICEECGELVRRGIDHICYLEENEYFKRSHIDFLVNGGE